MFTFILHMLYICSTFVLLVSLSVGFVLHPLSDSLLFTNLIISSSSENSWYSNLYSELILFCVVPGPVPDSASYIFFCVHFTPDQLPLFQCVYNVCSLGFFCLTLPLRKNLLGSKRKAINIYFTIFFVCVLYIGPMVSFTCEDSDILLNASAPFSLVKAPPFENLCLTSLSCGWNITTDPGSSIYMQVVLLWDETYSYLFVIGKGHDSSNLTSVTLELDFQAGHRADDGRVYMIDSDLAWVSLFTNGPGCVGMELTFTQRPGPGKGLHDVAQAEDLTSRFQARERR